MERLLELILGGGLRLPLFDPELLALDRDFPRSDLLALLMLQRRGELAMSELAANLGAPLSTATGIGTRLARRGLAQRRRSPADRRVVLISLTPAGATLAGRVQAQIDRLLQRIENALSPDELQQLTALAFKVTAALATAPVPGGTKATPPPPARRITLDAE